MRFPLVLFDLDGTLVDSLPDIAGALNHVLQGAGRAPVPLDVVRGLVGEGVVRLVEKALSLEPDGPPASAAELSGKLRDFYNERPCTLTVVYPGISETLLALRRRPGRRLAVLTNKPGEVSRALLRAVGLAQLFDVVVGDGDGHPRKPDPDAARALMARFAVTPAETLMVGDGLPDMAVARAAGCPAAAALWGYTDAQALLAQAPAFSLKAPGELLALDPSSGS